MKRSQHGEILETSCRQRRIQCGYLEKEQALCVGNGGRGGHRGSDWGQQESGALGVLNSLSPLLHVIWAPSRNCYEGSAIPEPNYHIAGTGNIFTVAPQWPLSISMASVRILAMFKTTLSLSLGNSSSDVLDPHQALKKEAVSFK
jgi:hypothetical protein